MKTSLPHLLLAVPLAAVLASATASAQESAAANQLTPEETTAGWQLLFNGNDLGGWHNFRSDKIRPGWQVQDGALACVDPHNAGDLATAQQYDWFELDLEFKMGEGANSGIMYHASPEGKEGVAKTLGREGSIAVQVHGGGGWPKDAKCRWKNIRIKTL